MNAGDYFADLGSLAVYDDTPRGRYRLLARLFSRLLNDAVADVDLLLPGPYARLAYLLKVHQAPRHLQQSINDARIRFCRIHSLPKDELMRLLCADFEAVTRLVALIFDCDIPPELEARFSHEPRPKRTARRLADDYLRLSVVDLQPDFIAATPHDDPDRLLRIAFRNGAGADDADFSYLRPMLCPGSQINVVAPRIAPDGTVLADLIVYEPDYLIDVSSVASCFESYATDPLVALIKRLQPAPTGDAINLGNFAGQILDEVIHDEYRSYGDSAMRFFRNNALALSACRPGPGFHSDAREQIANIDRALGSQMSQHVPGFDRRQIMVEPSFFSEMLGLQGRMDFLQLDFRLLAEQKSGKGEWPQGDYTNPRIRRPHYVQLLLYMAIIRYNYAQAYTANGRELHAFLMYSKYKNSLVGLGFAPALLRQAMEIRNGIAYDDIRRSTEGFDFLTQLNADSLCSHGSGTLWERYTRPALDRIFKPIRSASEVERAYFLRMMRFVAREHLLAKTGNKQKQSSGFASTWLNSLDDKLDAGNIFTGLRLDHNFGEGKISTLHLSFEHDEACDMANFRVGDIVILYPYLPDTIPDARRSMVFRCTIADISGRQITLTLRAPQSGPAPFDARKGCLWAIEHDFLESSFASLYRGLHALLGASQRRRDLLMLRREPQVSPDIQLNGNYGCFNELVARVAAARDLFLIIGPPGTGKTSYGMLYAVQEELTHPHSNILALAYTNRAVDEICSKLSAAGIEFLRLGSEAATAVSARPSLLKNKLSHCANVDSLRNEIMRHRVVVATTTAINTNLPLFALKQFSLAVIDEASQILEPQLAAIFAAEAPDGSEAISRFVLIGDHKQLPAIVQQSERESAVDEECLRAIGLYNCRTSLFERLVRRYAANPAVCYMLTRQGRMHPDIADFVSEQFYGKLLLPVPLPHQTLQLSPVDTSLHPLRQLIDSNRVLFINIENTAASPTDKVNQPEARLIAGLLRQIYEKEIDSFDPDDTVGVIVPYRNQIAAIRNHLLRTGIKPLADVTVDTVERFQGSQRKYIIYGFTVSRYYQLQFLCSQCFDCDGVVVDRKLNVALTRAREHQIIVGNAALLRRDPIFSRLIDHIEHRGGFRSSAPPDAHPAAAGDSGSVLP